MILGKQIRIIRAIPISESTEVLCEDLINLITLKLQAPGPGVLDSVLWQAYLLTLTIC